MRNEDCWKKLSVKKKKDMLKLSAASGTHAQTMAVCLPSDLIFKQ